MRFLRAMAGLAVLFVVGCGSDGGGSPSGGSNPVPVSGTVYKGAVDGAEVTVYALSAAGVRTAVAGPFTTDVAGVFSGEVPAGSSGYYLLVADGGTYRDEATGSTVTIATELLGMIHISGTSSGAVTPYTHAAVLNAMARMDSGQTVQAAFANSHDELADALGFDPSAIQPEGPPPTRGQSAGRGVNEQIYTAMNAGVSELLDGNAALAASFGSANSWDLVTALIQDLSDGVLDGEDIAGATVQADPDGAGAGTAINFPALDPAGVDALLDAARGWAAIYYPGLTIPDYDFSEFGDIQVNVGAFGVTGTIAVSGAGSGVYGTSYTPDTVAVVENGPIVAIAFASTLGIRTIGVGWSSAPNLGVTVLTAQRDANVWTGQGLPIPGVIFEVLSANHYRVTFEGAAMTSTGGSGGLTLNGVFNVQRQ